MKTISRCSRSPYGRLLQIYLLAAALLGLEQCVLKPFDIDALAGKSSFYLAL